MATFNSPTAMMTDPRFTYNGVAFSWSHSHLLEVLERNPTLTIRSRYGVMDVVDRKGLLGE